MARLSHLLCLLSVSHTTERDRAFLNDPIERDRRYRHLVFLGQELRLVEQWLKRFPAKAGADPTSS